MRGYRVSHSRRAFPIAILVLTLSLGCMCLPTGILRSSWPPTSTSGIPTKTPGIPTRTLGFHISTPSFAMAPIKTDTPSASSMLDAQGPWLLIETDQGLWATNPDGSGLTRLTNVDYWNYNVQSSIQPGGNLIAFLSPANDDFHHMSLNLLSLPDGKITKITNLTSEQTEVYANSAPGDNSFEALRAIRDDHNLSWTTDGAQLAFVGLMDGPSADIYVYNTATHDIQLISRDNDQDYWPSWSPDGQTLLYFATQAFGTGAGFDTTGVWALSSGQTDASLLYTPNSGSEELVGWLDDTTAVLDTWTPAQGSGSLRLFDITTSKPSMLSAGAIVGAAADSFRGAVLFADSRGLYLLTASNHTPVTIGTQPVRRIDPVKPGDFYFTVQNTDDTLATYGTSDMDHQVSPVAAGYSNLAVAMYGWIWGWTSEDPNQPGAWISGPGIEIGQIFNKRAQFPISDLENNFIFFAPESDGSSSLYRTTFDAYYKDLTLVTHIGAQVRDIAWLGSQ